MRELYWFYFNKTKHFKVTTWTTGRITRTRSRTMTWLARIQSTVTTTRTRTLTTTSQTSGKSRLANEAPAKEMADERPVPPRPKTSLSYATNAVSSTRPSQDSAITFKSLTVRPLHLAVSSYSLYHLKIKRLVEIEIYKKIPNFFLIIFRGRIFHSNLQNIFPKRSKKLSRIFIHLR